MGRRTAAASALGALAGAAILSWFALPLALAGIHLYQRAGAPLAARVGIVCRFTPSCSRYAEVVIARDGVLRGGWKAAKRLSRCGPWTAPGTIDMP